MLTKIGGGGKNHPFHWIMFLIVKSGPALVRTYCFDTTVADSACSATSYLCGVATMMTMTMIETTCYKMMKQVWSLRVIVMFRWRVTMRQSVWALRSRLVIALLSRCWLSVEVQCGGFFHTRCPRTRYLVFWLGHKNKARLLESSQRTGLKMSFFGATGSSGNDPGNCFILNFRWFLRFYKRYSDQNNMLLN